jgi:hypothetical protein
MVVILLETRGKGIYRQKLPTEKRDFITCDEFEVFVSVRRGAAVSLGYWCPKRLKSDFLLLKMRPPHYVETSGASLAQRCDPRRTFKSTASQGKSINSASDGFVCER